MSLNEQAQSLFNGFSRLDRNERYQRLVKMGALTPEDIHFLNNGAIQSPLLADKLIENVIGYFQLPLGVATNFCIDGRDYVIPMAVEETSIIAALSKTAKWIRNHGSIQTQVTGTCILGQIQLANIHNWELFEQKIQEHKNFLIEKANQEVAGNMVQRGGGVKDLQLRRLERKDQGIMGIIHLSMNSCDAMGANIINQVLEYLKEPIEQLTGELVTMCILTNLNDQKLTTARVVLEDIEDHLGHRIQEASFFAEQDPYRAATHNKGVMNGIDPVLIATGNDWRAVEAGVHAYAARNGSYEAITQWRYDQGILTGVLTAPLVVGIIGGVTSLHPTAKMCLSMLDVDSANQLSGLIAAVGLVQNLGALRALCTDGIIKGHMKLHIDNLLLSAGATAEECLLLKQQLEVLLSEKKRISLNNAKELLTQIREAQLA